MKEYRNLHLRRLSRIACVGLVALWLGVLLLPVATPAMAQCPTPNPPAPKEIHTLRSVFLRAGPSVSWRVIATLPGEEVLTVLDQCYNWYKVSRADGTVGWVSGSFVSTDPFGSGGGGGSTGAPAFVKPPDVGTVAMVTAPLLNVRSGPGLNFPAVGTASKGEMVTILDKNKAWRFVQTAKGVRGWVNSFYLSGQLGAANPFADVGGGGGTTTTGGGPALSGPLHLRLVAFDHAVRDPNRPGGAIATIKVEFDGGVSPFNVISDGTTKLSGVVPTTRLETGSGVVIATLTYTETTECAGTIVHTVTVQSADGQAMTQGYYQSPVECPNS
ncbi:MAG: SH3 domain-containing protein [Chloroflexi bacterium]|nr:SH3 domain-containing protein [Chloroflexota bacterium]